MTQVVLVHGWCGHPSDGWWPWLVDGLKADGYSVFNPQMPSAEKPNCDEWVSTLNSLPIDSAAATYLIGHSLGCVTILKYLQQLPIGINVKGVILVAGFVKDLTFDGYDGALANFFEVPIDWVKILQNCDMFWVISSDNDSTVSTNNHIALVNALNANEKIEHNKFHMTGDDGIFKLPSVLSALEDMSNKN